MCGIFLYCGAPRPLDHIRTLFDRTQHRGPDNTQCIVVYPSTDTMLVFGFHRLAINGMHRAANQPFTTNNTFTLCNGEIWNHRALHTDARTECTSGSDCEVVPHYYRYANQTSPRYHHEDPFEELCKVLDGVFGIVLYDRLNQRVNIGRDRIGIRSLYYALEPDIEHASSNPSRSSSSSSRFNLWVASELKSLPTTFTNVRPFPPGHTAQFDTVTRDVTTWNMTPYWSVRSGRAPQRFHTPTYPLTATHLNQDTQWHDCVGQLRRVLVNAVKKRFMSDRPIGCVLSGGLDSTVVTAIACQLYKQYQAQSRNSSSTSSYPPLRTYTIGLEGAEDFKWARLAADHFGTDHHEFVLTEQEFLDAIPEVIAQIESYDVTTVRASVGNWLLAKRIAETGKDTVLFCGDVADELLGGYRGFGLTKDTTAFEDANIRMLENIHRFDVLRCEKSFAGHGLEARVPFADKDVVSLTMDLPPEYKMWGEACPSRMEKDILRQAFAKDLPEALVWRRKEAFSDGVSKTTRSWYQIIQDHLAKQAQQSGEDSEGSGEEWCQSSSTTTHAAPYDMESAYYRSVFEGMYGSVGCIPYLWKQPFSREKDPSARCLGNYGGGEGTRRMTSET